MTEARNKQCQWFRNWYWDDWEGWIFT